MLFIPPFFLGVAGCLGRQRRERYSRPYAIAEIPTPVLNTPNFSFVFGGKDGKTLHLDDCGQIRELEFIAFPKTVFKIEEIIENGKLVIYKITTKDYPYPTEKGYFIDSRFVKTVAKEPPERPKQCPAKEIILRNLISARGSIYTWGSNYRKGVPQMLSFYPLPADSSISPKFKNRWMLPGLDCSGLLYEATNGYTPRNTNSLVNFGESVQIAGLGIDQILQKVESLDIIVWQGHAMIILNKGRAIESRMGRAKDKEGCAGGVRIRHLKELLNEILKNRVPVDHYTDKVEKGKEKFVIRRWYYEAYSGNVPG